MSKHILNGKYRYIKSSILAFTLISTPAFAADILHDARLEHIAVAYQHAIDNHSRNIHLKDQSYYLESPNEHQLSLRNSSVDMLVRENLDKTTVAKRVAIKRFLAMYQSENFITESELLNKLSVK
jgi:hypothetical protein